MNNVCCFCKHLKNGCDIMQKIKDIADIYECEIEVKIRKCKAFKKTM